MRTTLDLSDEAYQIARTVAREQRRSLGRVVSDFIIGQPPGTLSTPKQDSKGGFPTFRCIRRVTSEDVKALDEES